LVSIGVLKKVILKKIEFDTPFGGEFMARVEESK
jgi:hypothetical protein